MLSGVRVINFSYSILDIEVVSMQNATKLRKNFRHTLEIFKGISGGMIAQHSVH